MNPPVKAWIIAAPSSGCGKTTLTMGLIAALRRRGLSVQPFKAGPDYIDSAYHSRLAGRPCINLDTWMTPQEFVRDTFARHCAGADIAIIEGVMGLFDGHDDGAGSTAALARLLDLPVLHVLDAGQSAQTAAAVLHGLETFDPQLRSCGALFNGIASDGHWKSVRRAAGRCTAPVLGYLRKTAGLALPERQLGLLSVHEHGLPADYIDRLIAEIEATVQLDALLECAAKIHPAAAPKAAVKPAVRLGIARDEAFCFYYQDNLDLLAAAGIELVEFSPLHDRALPENLNGLYLGGGFPEEFAARLAANGSMLAAVRAFDGKILAECGGLIYLCQSFTGLEGSLFPLVGRIAGSIRMTATLQACGYREVTLNRDTLLGPRGTVLRGHEFHWSQWAERPADDSAFQTAGRAWGWSDGNVLASYFHLHVGSIPQAAHWFREALGR